MPAPATRPAWRAAALALADQHEVMRELHRRHGPPDLPPGPPAGDRFAALAQSIAYQQLAGRAAAAIWARVEATVGSPFSPERVLATGYERLRAAGLSNAKVSALLDLAEKTGAGVVRFDRIARMADEQVVEHLTVVRGIGPWTAQMFLLFDLRRLDVWPVGDYGVRAGFARAFELPELPSERRLAELGEPFAPYRSVVAWWCWREVDQRSAVAG